MAVAMHERALADRSGKIEMALFFLAQEKFLEVERKRRKISRRFVFQQCRDFVAKAENAAWLQTHERTPRAI